MAAAPAPRSPLAGGFLIALGAMVGTAIGLFTLLGPTRGFLLGMASGVVVSLAIWLVDRRRDA